MLEVSGRVVAGPVLELDAGTVDLDGQFAIAAVTRGVCGVESDGIVGRCVALHLGERGREIVGVEERLAAGVRAERRHHFLRGEVRVHVVADCASVECASSAQAAG